MIFEVKSSLKPEEVNDVMLDTFRLWLNWSLGLRSLSGHMVSNPSGKLAASYKLEQIDSHTFAIYVPSEAPTSVEDWVIRQGRGTVDLKAKMLGVSAHGKVHVGKKPPHYRWRDVPIRQAPASPKRDLKPFIQRNGLDIKSLLGKPTDAGIGLQKKFANMWTKEYQTSYGNGEDFRAVPQRYWKNDPRQQSRFSMQGDSGGAVKFRRMSDRPGSKPWILPAMPAFSAAAVMKKMMKGKIVSSGNE